jgi:hypothetical protein
LQAKDGKTITDREVIFCLQGGLKGCEWLISSDASSGTGKEHERR